MINQCGFSQEDTQFYVKNLNRKVFTSINQITQHIDTLTFMTPAHRELFQTKATERLRSDRSPRSSMIDLIYQI